MFIFVEGESDKRFIEIIIKPILNNVYNDIQIIKYAQISKEKILNFINSIKSMKADYLFITDLNNEPCVSAKKQRLKREIVNIDVEKIIVVIKEIEGFYLAGLDASSLKGYITSGYLVTENISKEDFSDFANKNRRSVVDFKEELLSKFSINEARKKNRAFAYLMKKIENLKDQSIK